MSESEKKESQVASLSRMRSSPQYSSSGSDHSRRKRHRVSSASSSPSPPKRSRKSRSRSSTPSLPKRSKRSRSRSSSKHSRGRRSHSRSLSPRRSYHQNNQGHYRSGFRGNYGRSRWVNRGNRDSNYDYSRSLPSRNRYDVSPIRNNKENSRSPPSRFASSENLHANDNSVIKKKDRRSRSESRSDSCSIPGVESRSPSKVPVHNVLLKDSFTSLVLPTDGAPVATQAAPVIASNDGVPVATQTAPVIASADGVPVAAQLVPVIASIEKVEEIKAVAVDRENKYSISTPFASDCVLIVDSEEFHVNKGFLSVHSKVFAKIFEENKQQKLELSDIKARAFNQFLDLLYPLQVPTVITAENVESLMKLAHRFKVSILFGKCEAFLMSHPDVSHMSLGKKMLMVQQSGSDALQKHYIDQFNSLDQLVALKKEDVFELLSAETKLAIVNKIMAGV